VIIDNLNAKYGKGIIHIINVLRLNDVFTHVG